MIAIIQLNFTSGIGDFYTYFCEIYYTAKKLKENFFSVKLILNSKRNIEFLTLFEQKYYRYFDIIDYKNESISLDILKEYTLIHGDTSVALGTHMWELLLPNSFKNNTNFVNFFFNFSFYDKLNYSLVNDFPKFNNTCINYINNYLKENDLEKFSLIHYRVRDDLSDNLNNNIEYNINTLLNDDILDSLNQISLSYDKVFICCNTSKVKNYLKSEFKNFITYDIENDVEKNRDYDNKAYFDYVIHEMILVSLAENIYLYSNYLWISNFLSYGFFNNKNGLINIKNNNKNFSHKLGI